MSLYLVEGFSETWHKHLPEKVFKLRGQRSRLQ